MSAWSLLPVVLLSSPLVRISHRHVVSVVVAAIAFPFVMMALAPAIAFAIHRNGVAPGAEHSALLAEPVEQLWRANSNQPLRVFDGYGDFGYGVAFYLPSHSLVVNMLDGRPHPDLDERVARDGIAMVCPADQVACVTALDARVILAGARAKRRTVDLTRTYFGAAGVTRRYVIAVIPPR
jgi:hypothetical protein